MDVIKVEPATDPVTEPVLSEFESVDIKQEDSSVPVFTTNSALKKGKYAVRHDPGSLDTESDEFIPQELIAVKVEPQGDGKDDWDSSALKQEQEDERMSLEHSICSDGAELIIGTEDFVGTCMSVEHVDIQQGDTSCESSVYALQNELSGKNSITGVKNKSRVNKKPHIRPQRKIYPCDLCTKSFTRQGHLDEHRRTHTGEKPYECEICSKTFTQRGNLAQHLRTHPGDRPFKCDFCVKRFSQRAHLVEHRRIHTGEKPFICDMCNRGFSQQGHLVAHTRTHTGEKPFKCHLCKRRFSSSGYLMVHVRAHSGDKPHKCDSCDKSFMQHRDLVKHSRSHTGAKPYKCEMCQSCFPDHSNLARHRRTHAESIHKYVSWKVSNNMEGTLSPTLEGHLINMQ